MTEQEFTELAEKHLTALQSYKMDKNGNFPIEIFGIEKLYKQLTLTDVGGSYSKKQVDDAYDKGFKDAMLKYRK